MDEQATRCPFCCSDFVVLQLVDGPLAVLPESLPTVWQELATAFESGQEDWRQAAKTVPCQIETMQSLYRQACREYGRAGLRRDFVRFRPYWILSILACAVLACLSLPLTVRYLADLPPFPLELATRRLNLNVLGARVFAASAVTACVLLLFTVRHWMTWARLKSGLLPQSQQLAEELDESLDRFRAVRDHALDLYEVDQLLGAHRLDDVPNEVDWFRRSKFCPATARVVPIWEWPDTLNDVRQWFQALMTEMPARHRRTRDRRPAVNGTAAADRTPVPPPLPPPLR